MSKYIFAIEPVDIDIMGVDYHIIVSTQSYFEQEGFVQDSYTEEELEEIQSVLEKYDAMEAMESAYECETYTKEEIKSKLEDEELFSYSEKLQEFIDEDEQ